MAACEHAITNGADIPMGNEPLDTMLARLHASILIRTTSPCRPTSPRASTWVAESAVNYYGPGVTQSHIDACPPHSSGSSTRATTSGGGETVVEEFRIGGLYSEEIETIVHFLELAQRYAPSDHDRESLELLIQFYRDGNEETFKQHMVSWLNMDGNVDYLNGFIEVYLDPRGVAGQFEGNVSSQAGGGLIDAISTTRSTSRSACPGRTSSKRTEVSPPVANVVNVLIETGDAGPVSPAAYNLPNYNDIRRDHREQERDPRQRGEHVEPRNHAGAGRRVLPARVPRQRNALVPPHHPCDRSVPARDRRPRLRPPRRRPGRRPAHAPGPRLLRPRGVPRRLGGTVATSPTEAGRAGRVRRGRTAKQS